MRELKTFGMSLQLNLGGLAVGRRVDYRQRATPVTNENSIGRSIDPNIVGVITEFDPSRRCVIRASEQQHRTVTGIGNKKGIARWYIANTLRLLQSGNDVLYLLLIQIDNADGIITKFGHEQTLSGQIDRQMIDPALNIAQRNLLSSCSSEGLGT